MAAGESLSATAVSARAWLVLEVPGAWPRDVSAPGTLPAAAGEAVERWLENTPGSRLQFVRRPGSPRGGTRIFVVRSEESTRDVRRFELTALEDLALVDLAAGGEPHGRPLVLVCGHGARDQCCSLRGTAVFGALAQDLGDDELWISSHLGGHRFAANIAVLPAGLQFGRVSPKEAPSVVSRALAGTIELDRYRGRTCYPAPVQAAEHAVRAAAGLTGLGDLQLLEHENGRVRFRSRDGRDWAAIASESASPPVPASCGDEPAPQRAYSAELSARADTGGR